MVERYCLHGKWSVVGCCERWQQMSAIADISVLLEQLFGVAANSAYYDRLTVLIHTNDNKVCPWLPWRLVRKTDESPAILGTERDELVGEVSTTRVGLEHIRSTVGQFTFQLVQVGTLYVGAYAAPDDGANLNRIRLHFPRAFLRSG